MRRFGIKRAAALVSIFNQIRLWRDGRRVFQADRLRSYAMRHKETLAKGYLLSDNRCERSNFSY
jgi:hypothetical protein